MLNIPQIILIVALILLLGLTLVGRVILVSFKDDLIQITSSLARSVHGLIQHDCRIADRLSPHNFTGLPLTMILAASLGFVILFAGVASDVMSSKLVATLDLYVSDFLATARIDFLTRFMVWVTFLANWQVLLVFSSAIVLILLIWRKSVYALPLLFSLAGSMAFTELLKLLFQRGRPAVAFYSEFTFSFPSGHATAAVAFYGYLVYLLYRNFRAWETRVNVLLFGFLVVFLVGFSRVYLGVHYPSDIWGGFLAGFLWLSVSITVSEWLVLCFGERKSLSGYPLRNIASICILMAALFIYVRFAMNSLI